MPEIMTSIGGRWAPWRRWVGALGVLLLLGCSAAAPPDTVASPAAEAQTQVSAVPGAGSLEILSLDLRETDEGARLEVGTSGSLVWTSFRDDLGRLVVEFPNAAPRPTLGDLEMAEGLVESVRIEAQENGARPFTSLVISTRTESEHAAEAEVDRLVVTLTPVEAGWLAAQAEPEAEIAEEEMADLAAQSEQPFQAAWQPLEEAAEAVGIAATRLENIEVVTDDSRTSVKVLGDGRLDASTFVLESPDRFVIDVLGVVNTAPLPVIEVARPPVERVRVAQFKSYPDLVTRVVIDLSWPSQPSLERSGEGLVLSFGGAAGQQAALEEAPMEEPGWRSQSATWEQPEEAWQAPQEPLPEAALEGEPESEEPAWEDTEPDLAYGPANEGAESPAEGVTPAPAPVQEAWAEPPVEVAQVDQPSYEVYQAPEAEPEYGPVAEEVIAQVVEQEPSPPPAVPGLATPAEPGPEMVPEPALASAAAPEGFGSRSLDAPERTYYGEPMTMQLKDADLKDVLRSFAQISGLNIVVQPGVSGTVTVELTDVPWDQALEQILKINELGYELEGNIMRIAPISQLREEAEEQQRLKQAQALSIPLRTVIRRVSYADANAVASVLQSGGGASLMSQRGSVVVDRRTNTLIIKELPEYLDTVIAVIENLDTPEDQVMIEARIVETTKRFSRSLGIAWGFQGVASDATGNATGLEFPNNIQAEGSVQLLTGATNGLLDISMGNVLNTFRLDAVLQAAETEGLINILSAPRITTLNNERATIQSGLQIPVQTIANNTVSVQFVNATLRLDVTPHVTAEGTVLMDVNIQKREPQLAFAVVGATNAPIATKDARTRVIVRDGGTTVIGGIYKVSTDSGEDRVPGLANIPIIKHLFKNRRRSDENEELLIFITPRVVKL